MVQALGYLLIPVLLFPVVAVAQADCEVRLLPAIDLALAPEIKSVKGFVTSGEVISADYNGANVQIPTLNGIRLVPKPVLRSGRPIGFLGRTKSMRAVLLEPIPWPQLREAVIRNFLALSQLSKHGLAVPVFGITEIKSHLYFVRPALAGEAPLAYMGALTSRSRFSDIERLEEIRALLEEIYPAFVNWGIIPELSWRDRPSDSDFDNEVLPAEFRPILDEFLDQIKFARIDGRLQIEVLPAMITEFSKANRYPIVREMSGRSWRFERWNWYRYLLGARLEESEKAIFYDWIKSGKRIEWMMRFQFLGRLVYRSKDFPAPRTLMTGGRYAMILDAEVPFPRPTQIAFKNRRSLTYHFNKHGSEMGMESPQAYLDAASDFIMAPPNLDRLYFYRKNGDLVLTDIHAQRLAVFNASGEIRTFFDPSVEFHGHGHNPYYIYEQILKDQGFIDE